jgi:3-phenylpropionate/trans-cinnamate dioxygenase ferredoxin subunit
MQHTVCPAEELPAGSRRIVDVEGRSIGVFNLDGELYALRNQCPHRGAPLCRGGWDGTMLPSAPDEFEFGLEGRVVRCPWHAREFDLVTGASLLSGDPTHVRTYDVSICDGHVVVEV